MPRAPNNTFRLRGQRLFLTYPKFDLNKTKEEVLEELKRILQAHDPPYDVINYIVAVEQHKDGTPHLHVYLQLDQRASLSGANCLDLWGKHGKYEVVRSPKKVEEYCTKEGDFITNFYTKKKNYGTVLQQETKEEFLATLQEVDPRSYVLNKRNIDYFVDQRFGQRAQYTPSYGLESYRIVAELNDWFRRQLNKQSGRGTPLILESPSRFGKTEYIRTLMHEMNIEYVYMNSIFNADAFPIDLSNVRFIVLDDMVCHQFFKFSWKPFWGCQRQFTITDKYKAKRDLIFPKPWALIWLCNEKQNPQHPSVWLPEGAIEYLEQQETEIVTLDKPLFDQ